MSFRSTARISLHSRSRDIKCLWDFTQTSELDGCIIWTVVEIARKGPTLTVLVFQLPHGQRGDLTMNSPSPLQPFQCLHWFTSRCKQNKESHSVPSQRSAQLRNVPLVNAGTNSNGFTLWGLICESELIHDAEWGVNWIFTKCLYQRTRHLRSQMGEHHCSRMNGKSWLNTSENQNCSMGEALWRFSKVS